MSKKGKKQPFMLFLLKAPPMALLSSFTAVHNYKGVLQMQITSRVVFYVLDSSRRSAITAELRFEHILSSPGHRDPGQPWFQSGSPVARVQAHGVAQLMGTDITLCLM